MKFEEILRLLKRQEAERRNAALRARVLARAKGDAGEFLPRAYGLNVEERAREKFTFAARNA